MPREMEVVEPEEEEDKVTLRLRGPSAEDITSTCTFEEKVERLAGLIREARHCIFVTGAGISTNAKIRDYRGPEGIWTEGKKKGLKEGELLEEWDDLFYHSIPAAIPTFTHRGITALVCAPIPQRRAVYAIDPAGVPGKRIKQDPDDPVPQCPYAQFVISQNEDGLHMRSGLPQNVLSEIHGNDYIEICGHYQSSSSSSEPDFDSDDEEAVRVVAEIKAARAKKKKEKKPRIRSGCGHTVVRDFVTYYKAITRGEGLQGRHSMCWNYTRGQWVCLGSTLCNVCIVSADAYASPVVISYRHCACHLRIPTRRRTPSECM